MLTIGRKVAYIDNDGIHFGILLARSTREDETGTKTTCEILTLAIHGDTKTPYTESQIPEDRVEELYYGESIPAVFVRECPQYQWASQEYDKSQTPKPAAPSPAPKDEVILF